MTERLRGWVGEEVLRAAAMLRDGRTVAFPTETVYGLGANALDAGAVGKIFQAKERPGWDPLIVHVGDREMLRRVAVLEGELEQGADRLQVTDRLMEAFWPGPLTLLLPRAPVVPDAVTAGRPLVGVRMPRHPVAMELIRMAGVPVAAPSANRFGRTSPTTAAHVLEDLDGRIDAVLDGGATTVGVESTVLDVGQRPMVIYRPGAVTVVMIEEVCGAGSVRMYVVRSADVEEVVPDSLPSPGVGLRHYAPRARLVLVREVARRGGALVDAVVAAEVDSTRPAMGAGGGSAAIGVMLPDGWDVGEVALVYPWAAWDDAEALARRLFDGLRTLDEMGAAVIVCPLPGAEGIGAAVRDRLEKAAWRR
jgi:L-threonylcarbamoyladenylate synthase